jgi:hypothetical protein
MMHAFPALGVFFALGPGSTSSAGFFKKSGFLLFPFYQHKENEVQRS